MSISHIEYDARVTQATSERRAAVERVDQKASELKIAVQDAEIARTQGRLDAQAEGEAAAIVTKGEAQAKAKSEISKALTTSCLEYSAFDNDSTRYYSVPTGRDGLPIILGTD